MRKIEYEIGTKFHRLTLVEDMGAKNGHKIGRFRCDCGNEVITPFYKLRQGTTKSCGCLRIENFKKALNGKPKTEKQLETIKKIGQNNRKYDKICSECGTNKHYAKGLCKNCYNRKRNKEIREQ